MKTVKLIGAYCVLALGALFCVTTAIGIFRSYSPVPWGDEWYGAVHFYSQIKAGHWDTWWSLYNEHRIIIPRIFFWIDYRYFEGRESFLLLISFLLQAATAVLFFSMVYRMERSRAHRLALMGMVLILLFSWIQKRNFVWGFQCQFIGVFTFAILSFWLLDRSLRAKSAVSFYCSIAAAMLSTYCMANGILTFPIMLIQAGLLRIGWKKMAILSAFFAINAIPYLLDYSFFAGQIGDDNFFEGQFGRNIRPPQAVLESKLSILHFTIRLLGGPFYFVARTQPVHDLSEWINLRLRHLGMPFIIEVNPHFIADVAGIALILLSIAIVVHVIWRRKFDSIAVVLLPLLLFLGGTAFLTASSRIIFGLDYSLAERYRTPALIAWISMFLLLMDQFRNRKHVISGLWTVTLALSLLLIYAQFAALTQNFSGMKFKRNLAALSLKLQIRDIQAQGEICAYPYHLRQLLAIAQGPIANEHNVFGEDWMRAVGRVSFDPESVRKEALQGNVEGLTPISGSEHLGVQGWIQTPPDETSPSILYFVNDLNETLGYAVNGEPKSNLAEQTKTGWKGYITRTPGLFHVYMLSSDGSFYPVQAQYEIKPGELAEP